MSELTTKSRNALPSSKFAESAERKYPIENKSHAANAKARATQMHNKGLLSLSAEELIDHKANQILNNKE